MPRPSELTEQAKVNALVIPQSVVMLNARAVNMLRRKQYEKLPSHKSFMPLAISRIVPGTASMHTASTTL